MQDDFILTGKSITNKLNRRGDKLQPCLRPLCTSNQSGIYSYTRRNIALQRFNVGSILP